MHFFSRYSYIWSFPKEKEDEYNKFVLSSSLTSLRTVAWITIFGMSLFLVIDFFRDVEYSIIFGTRAFVFLNTGLIILASYRMQLSHRLIQACITILGITILGSAMVTATFGRMPSFYLTNLVFLIQVLVVTASGLHFRNALILNVILLGAFVIFSQLIKHDPFYISQYPHLFSIFIYIHIAGAMLERRRRLNFLQFQDLAEQKSLVENLSAQKSKIISILSHDIASPIHSLLGIVNLERRGMIKPEEIKPLMEKVGDELSRVHTLMFSLMRWSKSQMEGFTVVPSLFELNQLVQENIDLYQSKLTNKELTIRLEQQQDSFWVKADVEMIRLVLRNLISNAIKFSIPGTEIGIQLMSKGSYVQFVISNDGPRLSQETVNALFGFEMTSTPGTRNEKGSGLGLALAYHFIELNNGKISLHPYTDTNITTFSIELPLMQAPLVENILEKAEA